MTTEEDGQFASREDHVMISDFLSKIYQSLRGEYNNKASKFHTFMKEDHLIFIKGF